MSRSFLPDFRRLAGLVLIVGLGSVATLPGHAEPAPAEGGAVTQMDVKNPVGMTLKGTKVVDPKKGTAEATLVAALKNQADNGPFKVFLEHMHPKTKSEPQQVESLEAYQYKSSKGSKAAQCLHDDGKALVTVSKKDVNVAVEGGGNVGVKIMVWCGEGRMPVPFTLYPDGDVFRVTTWGLN